jgi:Peptidase family M28/FlgD Ig-like domain
MNKYGLLLLIMILSAGFLFSTSGKALVSIGTDYYQLNNDLVEILYISSETIIARVQQTDLTEMNRDNIDLQILDSNAEDAKYYLISHPNFITINSNPDWGEIVYREKAFIIIRNSDLNREEIIDAGFQVIELKPKKLPKEKILMSDNQRRTRDFIDDIISELEQDSVAFIIQSLQDFETRYAFADNRDEVTAWIQNRFFEIGFEDVILDSFYWNETWQQNVIASLPGNITPDEYIILGGHHDSIVNSGDPMIEAPGADDNASACAAVLEIARVLQLMDYQPDCTILLCTFAAEEFGLIGSFEMADSMNAANTNIRVMLNNDMIANNTRPPGEWIIDICEYSDAEYLTELGIDIMEEYTSLNYGTSFINSAGNDSYAFWQNGFNTTRYRENEFSPNYHTILDIIDYCDLAYCTEVVKLSAAMLLTLDMMPCIVDNFSISDLGTGEDLYLEWQANTDPDLMEYSIAVGTESGIYSMHYTTTDTTFIVSELTESQLYYIGISAVNNDGLEGCITEKSGIPYSSPLPPAGFTAVPSLDAVLLEWNENEELDLAGYNVYRSEEESGTLLILNNDLLTETYYIDLDANNQYKYYAITAVDDQGNESELTEVIESRAITLNSGILLVDATPAGNGSFGNPDEEDCDEFYNEVLSDFDIEVYDLEDSELFRTADMGIYSTLVWHSNKTSPTTLSQEQIDQIKQYLDFGGKLLVTAFKPSQLFSSYNSYPAVFEAGDFLYDYLKIAEINYNNMGRFYYSDPNDTSLAEVQVDTLKTLAGLNYHIFNVESISPDSGTDILFNYGSLYNDNDPFGVMNGEPVATGYFGTDFQTALFSFPFYYMSETEIQDLLNTLMLDYFGEEPAGTEPNGIIVNSTSLQQNYPNPFNPNTTISFSLQTETSNKTELTIYNLKGQRVKLLVNDQLSVGKHEVVWNGTDDSGKQVSSGLYLYRLRSGDDSQTSKMLLLK